MRRLSTGSLFPFTVFLLILFFGQALPADDSAPPKGKTVRIMTYNIRVAVGNGKRDAHAAPKTSVYDKIAEIIQSYDCDVVAFQEVDRFTKRSRGDDQLEELAKRTGLVPTFAGAIPLTSADENKKGEYGVGILSKEEPFTVKIVPLPGEEEERVLLIAEFSDFVLFNTHLSLVAESRLESLAIINSERVKFDKPVLLAGDFNFKNDSERTENLDPFWTILTPDEPTYPAEKPVHRLDYIFLAEPSGVLEKAENTILRASVVDEPDASDHRPVFVEWNRK